VKAFVVLFLAIVLVAYVRGWRHLCAIGHHIT
jgi:hypothetical protein